MSHCDKGYLFVNTFITSFFTFRTWFSITVHYGVIGNTILHFTK